MERRLERTEDDRRTLQAELTAARHENERLREDLEKAMAAEREAYQMQLNVHHQQHNGWIPFPNARHMPETLYAKPSSGPIDEGFTRADELIQEEMTASYADFMEGALK
jgi:hypothetical protein